MLSNQCAKCHQGNIFHLFLWMNEKCPSCGHRFEREEGFFMGSMIISYFISTLLTLPIIMLMILKFEMEYPLAIFLSSIFMLVSFPVIYRYSKIFWIHLEESLYQSFQLKRDQADQVLKAREKN